MARSGPPAHLTGSAIVLDESGEHVLLTHHPKARLWLQFGGHFEEGDATVWHGAAREALEESGIDSLTVLPDIVDLSRHALAASFGRCREHLDVRFAAIAPADAGHRVSASRSTCAGGPPTGCPTEPRQTSCHSSTRHVGSPVAEAEPRRRRDPVEVAPGPLEARVALDQPPELRPVAGLEQRCASSWRST